MAESYDVLVIGAGLSGLAAGVRLAHFGRRALVVDRHTRTGGLNSWYVRGRREISLGLHAFTNYTAPAARGGALGKLLRQLRLKRSDLRLAPQKGSAIRFPSATLRFDNHPDTLREEVRRAFPKEADNFDRFFRHVADTDEASYRHWPASARETMARFIRSPLLRDMLLCPVMFYGSPAGDDMDWLLFCVVWKCLFASGLAYPEGGIRPLLELLESRFRDAGGELRLGAAIERLDIEDGGVARARFSDGSETTAAVVLSSAGRVETLRLCSDQPAEAAHADVGSISVAELVIALDGKPAEVGLAAAAVFHSREDRLQFRKPDGLVGWSSGVLASANNFDRQSPLGEGQARMSLLANFDAWLALTGGDLSSRRGAYREAKAKLETEMLAEAERLGCRFDGHVRFSDLFTPLTLARYTGHAGGALYGSPSKTRTGEIGYRNLFLIGTDQGFHGIVGSMLSGIAMANRHVLGQPSGVS